MQNVTQEMPEVNMLEIFNAIKKQHKDVKEIPVNPRCSACIGGPVRALEDASHKFGCNVLKYSIQLTQVMPSYKPRLKFFPENQAYEKDLIDDDFSGIFDLLDDKNFNESENYFDALGDENVCNVCEEKYIYSISSTVQQEMVRLDTSYKCAKCRSRLYKRNRI